MITEAERLSVFEAYTLAVARRRDTTDCYRAAIEMLRRLHPDLPRERAATEAVRIITADERFVGVTLSRR